MISDLPADSSRLQRWKLEIQEYNYSLNHINGDENIAADMVSRLYTIQEANPLESEIKILHKELGHPGGKTL